MPPSILQAAEAYVARGWSVIPLQPQGKRPLLTWKPFQERYATSEELAEWFTDTEANVGIVTGQISGLFVLDVDSPDAMQRVLAWEEGYGLGEPITPMVKTAKGWHVYYAYAPGLRNFQGRPDLGYDVRGEGGYVVAPPSLHETGHRYEWQLDPCEPAPVPAWLKPKPPPRFPSLPPSSLPRTDYFIPKPEGERNMSLAQLAGHLLREKDEVATLELCRAWNARNPNPLPDREVEQTVHSIAQRDTHNHPRYGRRDYRDLWRP